MPSSIPPTSFRVAVLDDYQRVARSLAAWDTLGPGVEVEFFHDHVADARGLVDRLAPFDAVRADRPVRVL